ncbi:MAG: hypothetical protein LBE18_04355 [Planctomycetaceae bacterium]|jgi:hypothetical protein|nr:hypothetical protein [Planctomycetaceae bacterium]
MKNSFNNLFYLLFYFAFFFLLIPFTNLCNQILNAQTSGLSLPTYPTPAYSSSSPPSSSSLQNNTTQPSISTPNNNPTLTNESSTNSHITQDSKRITTKREKHDAVVLFNSANGHSVVLPGGWSVDVLEDFARFLLSGENITTQNFTINSITAKGKLVDSRIETNIQLNITTNNEKTIKIPLGLKEGVFPITTNSKNNEPELSYNYSGKSNFIITVDPSDGQYIAVISPIDSTPQQKLSEQKNKNNNDITPNSIPNSTQNSTLSSTPNSTPNLSTVPSAITSSPATTTTTTAATTLTTATTATAISSSSPPLTTAGEHHEISLTLWFPISQLAEGSSKLAISFPHAISSQFVLTIPSPDITATTQAPLIESSQIDNGKSTRFTMLGLKPNFEITWRKKNTKITASRPILEIKDANIIVQFDRRFISYDATLPVRSLQNTFDKILVRLPQDTILDLENSDKFANNGGYSIRMLSTEERNTINKQKNKSAESNETQSQINKTAIVEIQSSQKTLGPLNVRLIALRQLQSSASTSSSTSSSPPAVASDWYDIEGFDVIGAQRQVGTLSITIPDGTRPNWRSVRGINRIDPNTEEVRDEITAQFRFSLQPFMLRGQIITPQVRTNIKPEYQVKVEKGNLVMIMRLACSSPWSQNHSINVQLFDWKWNGEISPANIINTGGIEQTSDGILNIPLTNIPQEDFEIELKLNRKFDPESLPSISKLQPERKLLSLRFPQPQANWVEPSVAVIIPEDNVDLVPVIDTNNSNKTHTVGLTRINRRTARINIELPPRQREPLIYQSDLLNPIFVTEIEFYKQKIETAIKTDIRLLDLKEQIYETISYDVAYEPVDKIILAVPQVLDTNSNDEYGGIQAFIGNTILRIRDMTTSENTAEESQNGYIKKFIMLPEAMIGKFELGIKYSIPPINVSEDLSKSVTIPFVKPLNVTINSHKVNLIAHAGVNSELREESKSDWKKIGTVSPIIVTQNNTQPNNLTDNNTENKTNPKNSDLTKPQNNQTKIKLQQQRTIVFESTHYGTEQPESDNTALPDIAPNRLMLLISASSRDIFGTTIVERVWVQTWLTDSVRLDHAVFVINSSRDTLSIRIPEHVDTAKITVKKNGNVIPVEFKEEQQIVIIPLHESENEQSNIIEMWYQQSGIFRNKIQQFQISLPQFSGDVLVRRKYLQLILPPGKFIPFAPAGWIPEYKHTYNSLFTKPKLAFTMSDIGISEKNIDNIVISSNAPQFLFSSISQAELTSFFVVDGSIIVLISSSIALLAGLILIYFPKTRYAGLVSGLVVVLPIILFYQPISGLLFLQAASVGIILAIAAGYTYKLCYNEKQWIVPIGKIKESDVYSVIVDESANHTQGQNNSKIATIIRE